ncbi:MAG: DUF6444 domain-containing protein [Deltaproteobacteria bacterium]|nr:DUF6444 domain-containing protein [Deltaproteobacteria bacterium]
MDDRPEHLRITDEDWQNTPPAVRTLVAYLAKRLGELEVRINRGSSNSDQPPSSDGPFKDRGKQKKSDQKKRQMKQKRGDDPAHRLPFATCATWPGEMPSSSATSATERLWGEQLLQDGLFAFIRVPHGGIRTSAPNSTLKNSVNQRVNYPGTGGEDR